MSRSPVLVESRRSGAAAEKPSSQRLVTRAAIVHDWFQGFHGSERVVASMLDLFQASPDVYTFHAAPELLPERLAGAIRCESVLARLPGLRQRGHAPGRWRWLLPYMPRYFAGLQLDDYDLVISSSHACASHVRPRPEALHLCYCYTPMRYIWLPDTERGRVAGLRGWALRRLQARLRERDRSAAQRPDVYVAISSAVAERVRRFYDRECTVVHPPVSIDEFAATAEKEPGRLLWVNRLVPYKHPLEVVEAFRRLPDLRLTMVGIGPLGDQIRRALPANVELLPWVPRDQLRALFERSSGFIHVGEEDFGISMVEALAAGNPVLAVNRGGARDIVRPDVNGLFVDDDRDPGAIAAGVERLVGHSWDTATIRESAGRFSEGRFAERLSALLRDHGAG